jgi:hypothetical protein
LTATFSFVRTWLEKFPARAREAAALLTALELEEQGAGGKDGDAGADDDGPRL